MGTILFVDIHTYIHIRYYFRYMKMYKLLIIELQYLNIIITKKSK